MIAEQRAKEIVCKWAGTDTSNQPLENLIQAVASALAEKDKEIERLKTVEAFFNEGLRLVPPEVKELQAEIAALREENLELSHMRIK